MSKIPNLSQKNRRLFNPRLIFLGYLLNYLLLSTLTATVTTSETASANAAKVINKKLVSNVTIINFLSLKNIFVILKPMQRYVCLRTQPNVLHKNSKKIGIR